MKFYTTKEVAEMFDVTVHSVQRWIRSGHLEANKIGRKYLIKEEYVENMLEREKVKVGGR